MVEQELDQKLAWMESKKKQRESWSIYHMHATENRFKESGSNLLCHRLYNELFLHITIKCLIFKKYMKKGYCF